MQAATLAICGIAMITLTGCGCGFDAGPCPAGSQPSAEISPPDADVYVSQGNPYEPGPLAVRVLDLPRCDRGNPRPLLIAAPAEPGRYAVVVLQHGFQSWNDCYQGILEHLAGHGFIAVAPQMYEPGFAPLLGNPTAEQEAVDAAELLAWLRTHLSGLTGVTARTDRLGLAGHSRGGKVAWRILTADPAAALAVAGIDPVDGTGGPAGSQPRVVQGTFDFSIPALVIGAGIAGRCAPAGDNHEQFYAASRPPAWHIVVTDYGHGDMLDDGCAGLAALLCPSGPDPAAMRRLTAGLLTAFFRVHLQGDADALVWLTDTASAPARFSAESK